MAAEPVSGGAHPHPELLSALLARLDVQRVRGRADLDPTDILALHGGEVDLEQGRRKLGDPARYQVVEEELEAITAVLGEGLVVVVQAAWCPVVLDADEQRPAGGVGECRYGADGLMLHLAVGEVPTGG